MATYDQVLKVAQQLSPMEQARLHAALSQANDRVREEQVARNQAAIAMLDTWAASDDVDDGDESWDEMLHNLDRHRESARALFSGSAERIR